MARRAAAEEKGYDALLVQLTKADDATQAWLLEEIVTALKARANMPMPPAWKEAYEKLIASPQESIRRQAEFIAVKFGDQRVIPGLRKTLVDRKTPEASRRVALEALTVAKDAELPALLHELLNDPALRHASVVVLAAFNHPGTPAAILPNYKSWTPVEQQAAIATLTSRAEYVLPLLDAMEKGLVPRQDLSAFTVRQLTQLNNEQVSKRLNDVWGTTRLTSTDKAAERDSYKKQLNPAVLSKADLSHGRELFNKTCGTCHLLFGAGKQIGPDITGSNRANLDYLLENLLDPSAVIGKDYQSTLIVTANGRSLTGILKGETETAVTLQTPTEVLTIPKNEIESRKLSPLSLMPDG